MVGECDETGDGTDENQRNGAADDAALGAAFLFVIVFFLFGHDLRRLLWRLCGETDFIDLDTTQDIEHIHDALVLGGAVTADDDGDIRCGGFDGGELGFQLGEGDGHGVERDLAFVADGDGLHLRSAEIGDARFARAGEIHLHSLNTGGGHDDEDEQEDEVKIHHRCDVDVVVIAFG